MIKTTIFDFADNLRLQCRKSGIKTQWPDKDGCWSIVRHNAVVVRGELDVFELEALVQASNEQLEGRAQLFIDRLCGSNRTARDKSLSMLECNTAFKSR